MNKAFQESKARGFSRLHELRMENTQRGYDMEEMRPRFEALKTRHEDGTAPRAISAFNLFQTPEKLAEKMAELADLEPDFSLLEPSAGLGRLVNACRGICPLDVVAVEESPDCARELYALGDGVRILQRDFLSVSPEEIEPVDRVVMNPPFKMRRDIKHIQHALKFLKPGGKLIALCLSTHHREAAFMGQADSWEVIPAGTFRGEGTGVETILFSITAT